MTAFSGPTFPKQSEAAAEQIRQLQHVLDETTRKLDGVLQRRIQAEEELIECAKETKQHMNLLMENVEVIDLLHELGQLLQKEEHLNDQLGQSEEDRDLWKNLEDRHEQITNKAQSLSAEIVEVTQRLEKAIAYYKAAQSSVPEPTNKSKSNQTKPK